MIILLILILIIQSLKNIAQRVNIICLILIEIGNKEPELLNVSSDDKMIQEDSI